MARWTATVGLALVLLMALAASVTVSAVVRLGLFARREEIDIMRLVGSPTAFIRGPFVAEGCFKGASGPWPPSSSSRPGNWALLVATAMAVGAAGGLAGSRHAG